MKSVKSFPYKWQNMEEAKPIWISGGHQYKRSLHAKFQVIWSIGGWVIAPLLVDLLTLLSPFSGYLTFFPFVHIFPHSIPPLAPTTYEETQHKQLLQLQHRQDYKALLTQTDFSISDTTKIQLHSSSYSSQYTQQCSVRNSFRSNCYSFIVIWLFSHWLDPMLYPEIYRYCRKKTSNLFSLMIY